MQKFLKVIASSKLFEGVKEDKILSLLEDMGSRKVKYKKGEIILKEGDIIDSLGLILDGSVIITKEDFWGNRNILRKLNSGSIFAETFACSENSVIEVSAEAFDSCEILFINKDKLLDSDKNFLYKDQLLKNLLMDMANKNIAFTQKLSHVGKRSTREKLLSYLSQESRKNNSNEFDIPFSRQQLADYLFVERSGLSSEIGKMRDEGLLEFKKNHFILKER